MKNKHPYKPAKLVHHDYNINKRWYAECRVWDVNEDTMVRKRFYAHINRYKTVPERLEAGRQLVDYINDCLEKGFVAGSNPEYNNNHIQKMTVVEAFQFVYSKKQQTVRPSTLKQYHSLAKGYKTWAKKNGLEKVKIKNLTTTMIHDFLDSLFKEGNVTSNKTYNNYLGAIKSVINYMQERDHKIFERNPAKGIKFLTTYSVKHAAYSNEQMKKIKAEILKRGDHQLLLFIHFIYYTLARPNEIKNMKIGDIELKEKRIFIPRASAKNKKSDYVDIYPPLEKAIIEHHIMDYPKDYYVFSSNQTPGKKKSYVAYFWRKHIKILRALGLDKSDREYTLYSYKHSGAINLYLSGLEPVDIQKQCRHHSLQQTMDYLRELDLFRKTDHFDKVKSF